MKKEVRLLAIIISHDNKVLLHRVGDKYELPYGTMLQHERIENAYPRFIKSKTGLKVLLLDVVAAFNFDTVERISIAYKCIIVVKDKPIKALPEMYQWFKFNKKETNKLAMEVPNREILWRALSKI